MEHRAPPISGLLSSTKKPIDISLMSWLTGGIMSLSTDRLLRIPIVGHGVAIDIGVSTPTRRPNCAKAAARLTARDDFPTPPLPEATARTRVLGSSSIERSLSGRPPRSLALSAARSSGVMTSNPSRTAETPSTAPTSRPT